MKSSLFKLTIISLLILVSVYLYAGVQIVEFSARRINDVVVLEWATEVESGVSHFNIERSSDNIYWNYIGKKSASGNSTNKQYYSYNDNSVFKSNQNTFYYKLIVVYDDGQTESYDVIASINGNSGIRHTWGSIKAMFR